MITTPSATATVANSRVPSWYGQRIGREQRSWLSSTGDVDLLAGRTFPTSFADFDAAREHAAKASAKAGAVAIMWHGERFFITRAYNAELERGRFVLGQTQAERVGQRYTHLHRQLLALVDESMVHWR